MPSWLATRRASSTAESEQQPPFRAASSASPVGHCCSGTPTTSWPSRWSSAAARLESTPPDRATAILIEDECREVWASAPARDGRHDRDLVRLVQRRVQTLAQPDVLVVQEEVDELSRLAAVVEQPSLEAREAGVELVDRGPQVGGLHGDGGLTGAQAAQRTGDSEHGHFANSFEVGG